MARPQQIALTIANLRSQLHLICQQWQSIMESRETRGLFVLLLDRALPPLVMLVERHIALEQPVEFLSER